jgi:conjugative relaxase-like TrwC/TraI family protein
MLKCHAYKDIRKLVRYFEADFIYDGEDLDPLKRDQVRIASGLAPSWHGQAAVMLGLPPLVTAAALQALGDNQHPVTREQLTPRMRSDRNAAYEMTFSMPKGISLLYAIAGHTQLLSATTRAVQSTMLEVERQMRVRVRDGGDRDDRLSRNLVYALVPHRLARPQDGVADPQLHAHAIVLNVSRDPEEQVWKAGKFFHLMKNLPYLQTVFHSAMRREVELLGYRTADKGKFWDLDGIPKGLTEKFSSRQLAIKAEAKRLGDKGSAFESAVALFYRERKEDGIAGRDLWDAWVQRLTVPEWQWLSGYKPSEPRAVDRYIEVKPEVDPVPSKTERESSKPRRESTDPPKQPGSDTSEGGASGAAEESRNADSDSTTKSGGAGGDVKFESPSSSRQRLPRSTSLKAVVRFAAAQVFERLATVSELDLIKHVMEISPLPAPDIANVRAELERLPYERREVAGRVMYVDPSALAAEQSLIQKVVAGRAQFGPLVPSGLLGADVAPSTFPKAMRDAFARVAASTDLVTMVEAFPGQTSREFLSLLRPRLPYGPIIDLPGAATLSGASRAQALSPTFRTGYVVVSPSGSASAEGLHEAGVVAPQRLSTFLGDLKARNQARGGVVIVDQAHLLTTRDANQLVDAAKDIRARLVLIASDVTVRAPGPGNVPRLLMQSAGIQSAFTGRGSDVKSPHAELLEIAAKGHPGKALDKLKAREQCLEVPTDSVRTAAVAEQLRGSASSKWRPGKSLVVVPSRSERDAMNQAVRDGMKKRGLVGKGKMREQFRPLSLSDAAKRRSDSYAKGMVIEFNEKATRKLLGIPFSRTYKPGQRWTVLGKVVDGVAIRRGTRTGLLPKAHADKFDVFEKHQSELAKGDVIRFTRASLVRGGLEDLAHKTIGAFKIPTRLVAASRPLIVKGFTRAGDAKLEGGLIMPKNWPHWTHDYARTPSEVQGIQRDRIVFASDGTGKQETMGRALVAAMAAAKSTFQVVTDDFDRMKESVGIDARRLSATDAAARVIPPSYGLGPNGMQPGRREHQTQEQDRSSRRERDFERA